MVNNGRLAPAEVPASTFKSFLRRLYPQQCLIVKVIDIFDFHNSFIPTIASLVGRHKPIVLIVNKRDLLPAATSPTRVIKWVRSAANEMELHNIVDVHFVSSKTGQGVPEAFAAIQQHRGDMNVYVVGAANAGKSSFINQCLEHVRNVRHRTAATLYNAPEGGAGEVETKPGQEEASPLPDWAAAPTPDSADFKEDRPPFLNEKGEVDPVAADRYLHQQLSDVLGNDIVSAVPTGRIAGAAADRAQLQPAYKGVVVPAEKVLQQEDWTNVVLKDLSAGGDAEAEGDAQEAGVEESEDAGGAADDASRPPLTTSVFPGTTLGIVGISLRGGVEGGSAKGRLYDTPGLLVDSDTQRVIRLLNVTSSQDYKTVLPVKRLRPVTHNVRPGRSIFVGSFARVDYENDERHHMLFTWFGVLPLHITSTRKAEEVYEKHRGGVLGPPSDPEALERMGPLVPALDVSLADAAELSPSGVQPAPTYKTLLKKRKELARTSVADVALGGLGWLAVTPVAVDGSNMKRDAVQQGRLRVWTAGGLRALVRVPLLPYETHGTSTKDWERK